MYGSIAILVLAAGLAAVTAVLAALWRRYPKGQALPRFVPVIAAVSVCGAAIWMILPVAASLIGDSTTVSVPLDPFPPHAAAGIVLDPLPATITGGGVDQATLSLTGLSWPTRIVLALSRLTAAGIVIAVAIVATRLARSLQDADPFRTGTRALGTCAAIVAIGGVTSSILGDWGSWQAGQEALGVHSWTSSPALVIASPAELAQYGWPQPAHFFTLTVPWWPLLGGLGLALVAAAFRAGEHLRDDVRGLV
jgi:hypothetical protein